MIDVSANSYNKHHQYVSFCIVLITIARITHKSRHNSSGEPPPHPLAGPHHIRQRPPHGRNRLNPSPTRRVRTHSRPSLAGWPEPRHEEQPRFRSNPLPPLTLALDSSIPAPPEQAPASPDDAIPGLLTPPRHTPAKAFPAASASHSTHTDESRRRLWRAPSNRPARPTYRQIPGNIQTIFTAYVGFW